ncbi:ATP-binding protein [Streptomyces sp. NPDC056470]|uniref:ATP-binding protein n=1 Tax=Streptomyces sp. NPDC056470 TaxID=3345831 RepID=UPI0036757CE8
MFVTGKNSVGWNNGAPTVDRPGSSGTAPDEDELPVRIPAPRGPVDSVLWPLVHGPEAAGEARRVARAILTRWQVDEGTAEAVLLVVSELVTNAVEHANAPVVMAMRKDPAGGQIQVEIADGGPSARDGEWTTSCTPDEHGRGLALVRALSAAHGVRKCPEGSTHWARISSQGA